MRLRPLFIALALAALAVPGFGAAAPSVAAAPAVAGGYHPLSPARILDTRSGIGAGPGRVGPGGTTTFQVLGRGGLPATGVAAVAFNLTAVNPTTAGFVTAYPSRTPQPNVSNINFSPGMTRANLVTLPVGTDGKVSLYNSVGAVDLLADVVGFYDTDGTAGGYIPNDSPARVFDSRDPALGGPNPLRPGIFYDIGLDYGAAINDHVTAVAVNITAVSDTSGGYLTAWDGIGEAPLASTLNYGPHDVVPNMAVVPTSQVDFGGVLYPTMTLKDFSTSTVHVIVDVVGFYHDGTQPTDLRYQPLSPTRVVDTRTQLGGLSRFGSGETKSVTAGAGSADANTVGLTGNLTVVNPSHSTYLTAWNSAKAQPATSNLNSDGGQTVANSAFLARNYDVRNANGSTDVVIDVTGRFQLNTAPSAAPAALRSAGPTPVAASFTKTVGTGR